jgi:enoyl-CoA hydratase/carnithine racemase
MSVVSLLTYDVRNRVAWLGLNRPDKRNAINEQLISEIDAAVVRASNEARVIVLFAMAHVFRRAST